MSKNRGIEFATYISVAFAIWVAAPLLAKWLDSLYFNYPKTLADSPLLLLVGVCLILLGTGLVIWTIILFKTEGGGTPNPRLPPSNFVVSGPYKFCRNPMGLGGWLTLLGQAALYYSPSLLGISILFAIIIYFNAMFVEEPELRKRFGQPYEEYLGQVPRFFPAPWRH
jgi:protein-S-isoprenylcysteine O-methyltransferase Ste14